MSKSIATKTKAKVKSKLSFVPVGAGTQKRDLELSGKHDFKAWGDLVFSEMGTKPKAMGPYLVLNAAHTKTSNKGWLNAINCRNMFADGPNIDFLPQDTSFGGKVEVWMENVSVGDSFTVQFRVVCGYNGTWKISSSETAQFQTNIVPVSQSIDFFIPPVESNYGLVLIALEAQFSNSGSWVFHDVIINKVTF